MLYLNNKPIKVEHFPDGTQKINISYDLIRLWDNEILWHFENDDELITLIYVTNHIRSVWPDSSIILYVPYMPNARMDRTENSSDVFTFKYFGNVLNSLKFNEIYTYDMHSDVGEAVIDNVRNLSPEKFICEAVHDIKKSNISGGENDCYKGRKSIVFYYPDVGAVKKYANKLGRKYCYGIKNRDWKTGKITSLEIIDNGIDLKNSTVLMVDDIITYGGSMYHAALALKKAGVKLIYAYATHTENRFFDKEKGALIKLLHWDNSVVKALYTTDSILNPELVKNKKIKVMKTFDLGCFSAKMG